MWPNSAYECLRLLKIFQLPGFWMQWMARKVFHLLFICFLLSSQVWLRHVPLCGIEPVHYGIHPLLNLCLHDCLEVLKSHLPSTLTAVTSNPMVRHAKINNGSSKRTCISHSMM